jgi:hypothetical protein
VLATAWLVAPPSLLSGKMPTLDQVFDDHHNIDYRL